MMLLKELLLLLGSSVPYTVYAFSSRLVVWIFYQVSQTVVRGKSQESMQC